MFTNEIRTAIEAAPARSAWSKGVKVYALELLDELPSNVNYGSIESLTADMLNGADNWKHYSWGGCSLVYDGDIALRLCTPSELKKTRNGDRKPNGREEWLDTQARALSQAARQICRAAQGKLVIL